MSPALAEPATGLTGSGVEGFGLYIHIPFCLSKCSYCDFNSYPGQDALFPGYVSALVREMEQSKGVQARTLYIGGGTPTVLPVSLLAQVLEAAWATFRWEADPEITVEANPATADADTLSALRGLRVSRLSLGVQSFGDAELKMLGRSHSALQALEAFRLARQAGFSNLGLDLLYGLPGQSLEAWQASLETALELGPDHLSLYALTLEPGTPLARSVESGVLPQPDPDLAADMYEMAEDRLAGAGYVHYEISNWAARPSSQCAHNLIYWRNEPYLGFGAGAHSWANRCRWSNVTSPIEYTERILGGRSPVETQEPIGHDLEVAETMIMGLRLLDEGIELERFRRRFAYELGERFADEIGELVDLGLLTTSAERLRLTARGHLLANQVLVRFLPENTGRDEEGQFA